MKTTNTNKTIFREFIKTLFNKRTITNEDLQTLKEMGLTMENHQEKPSARMITRGGDYKTLWFSHLKETPLMDFENYLNSKVSYKREQQLSRWDLAQQFMNRYGVLRQLSQVSKGIENDSDYKWYSSQVKVNEEKLKEVMNQIEYYKEKVAKAKANFEERQSKLQALLNKGNK